MRRSISSTVKNDALLLRRQGYSIGEISDKLDVAKSTAYEWTKTIEGAKRFAEIGRQRWIKEIQPLGAQENHKRRLNRLSQIEKEVREEVDSIVLTEYIGKTIASMLYWAEGAKGRGMLQFANTDPRLILLFVTLLRKHFSVDERKLRVRVYLHWYHNEQIVKQFWSHLLDIPESQFQKTYRKKRSKERRFRRNFGGICFVRYNSEALRERILRYAYALSEKIVGKVDVPVA